MKPVFQTSQVRNNSNDYQLTAAAAFEGHDPKAIEPLQKSKEDLEDQQQKAPGSQSSNGRHSSSTAAVIGGVLGGACGAVALAAGWILFHNRRQAKRSAFVTAAIATPTGPNKPGPGAAQFGASVNTVCDCNQYINPRQQTPAPWSRPHAVQAHTSSTVLKLPSTSCTVPQTPAPSLIGNRAQVHQPVQYMHSPPVPQAASLGYQQTEGGFQQPAAAALTFDQVWADLRKLSPIREY
jgi:hypothetical protein